MKHDRPQGFTLIELLIAMAVMAFGILGFTFLNGRAIQNRGFSRDLNRAVLVAERMAEHLMYLDYNNHLLADDNSDAAATAYPTGSAGDTGNIAGLDYVVHSSPDGLQWYRVEQENQRYYVRWQITTGNSLVVGSPNDDIKLILIFAAFEKKDPKTGNLSLGGYNRDPGKIEPTIITFKMDPES
ncbi:MAG TPA: prepilin-type N-terminal cleavage/methylation domain-containing protein [Proteobacteria bacterium]|nr:prepilin-type N-terminal cleavage/methylation domain-containing protein [Pseudomonadota bacterium]